MKKKLKDIPEFKNENEEREFWGKADSSDYVDWDDATPVVFANLQPTPELKHSRPHSKI